MRIHLPLYPDHFAQPTASSSSSQSPLVKIGGDLVLIELQGELGWEGDNSNGVVGILGLERPDKPTLHLGEHHLLHGKMVNLQKPYAVIRKATGDSGGTTLEGDISDEEGAMEEEVPSASAKKRKTSSKLQKRKDEEEEEEEDPPLFAPEPGILPSTPSRDNAPASSSPFYPSSAPRDYSSELDPASSPPVWDDEVDDEEDEEREAEKQRIAEEKMKRDKAREKRKRDQEERTRHYEVVGIVRKKVVFALRPEPIVTATILPD